MLPLELAFASSQKGKIGPSCARPSPHSPMLRQLAQLSRRKAGPWLRTALPCFSHAAPARKRGRSGLAPHGPPHFSHAAPARPVVKEEGWALAPHGPPLILPCCASSHGSLPRKANFWRFSCDLLALRGEIVYSLRRTSHFINPFHLLLKPFRPWSEHHLYALFCIIIPRSIALWNTSSVKFAHRSSLIAHRSSLIEKIKTI